MSLTPGTSFGEFQVAALLGEGGMGQVYRARDAKLGRDVALKILPPEFTHDPDRVTRFKREAQVLASLSHPHIATIHGLEECDGIQALVMELVEGPTLADRIAQGPMPLEEVLPIAKQITDALEAAHEQGVVHRDLKPANIKLRPDGAVKVLDFGLAKAAEGASGANAISMSPTLTSPVATRVGMLLGTAAYMAPEQARGKPVDKRADVWAFGAVLYEMLTGRRAFEGEDISLTLAEVMKSEPDWSALPASTPPGVRTALKWCLNKDPRQRLHDIGDVRLLFDGGLDTSVALAAGNSPTRWRGFLPLAVAAVLFSLAGGLFVWKLTPAIDRPIMRSTFVLPESQSFTNAGRQLLAISSDGSHIAYVANSRLYLRSMAELDSKPIAGTEFTAGILNPVFSPDGQSLAFWTAGDETIRRISVGGGAAVIVCQATRPYGLSWHDDDIVFGQGSAGISRVPAIGGKPEVLLQVQADEVAHGPQILPGGQSILFTLAKGTSPDRWDKAQIVVQQLASRERKTLIDGGSEARFFPTGHLVYALEGRLLAVAFDASRLEVTGAAVPVVQGIRRADTAEVNTGVAHYAVSSTGTLIYVPGPESTRAGTRDLAIVDWKGNRQPLKLRPGSYETPRVSPDGTRIAYSNVVGSEQQIYIHELSGLTSPRQLTFGGRNRYPVWSADGVRVAFQSDRDGDLAIFWQRADGNDVAERLTKPEPGMSHIPESFSPGGVLVFAVQTNSGFSSWILSLRDKKTEPFGDLKAKTPIQAVFAPDGHWLAYRSDRETGFGNVYLQPFPPNGTKFHVARAGAPAWSPDGKRIFFMNGGQIFVSTLSTTPGVTIGNSSPAWTPGLGTASIVSSGILAIGGGLTPRQYDSFEAGIIIPIETDAVPSDLDGRAPQIHVVVNWLEELKQRVPSR